jgi:cell division protein FtsZ
VLINITGGHDLTLFELDEAANRIREKVDPDANIIVGSTLDPSMNGAIRVSVVATGIDLQQAAQPVEQQRRSMVDPVRAPLPPQAVAPAAPQRETAPAPEPVYAQPAARYEPVETRSFEPAAAPRPAAPQRLERPVAQPDYQQPNLFQREVEQPEPARYAPAARQEPAGHGYAGQDEQGFDIDDVFEQRAQPPVQPQAEAFTAPRRPLPGTPSPETLERLQRAVQKAPEQSFPRQRVAPPVAPQPEPERGSRFGIGSLISRMAGHATEAAPSAAARRVAPPMQSYEEDRAPAASDDRIEIPAFLRRQAN